MGGREEMLPGGRDVWGGPWGWNGISVQSSAIKRREARRIRGKVAGDEALWPVYEDPGCQVCKLSLTWLDGSGKPWKVAEQWDGMVRAAFEGPGGNVLGVG